MERDTDRAARFASTAWSRVLRAAAPDDPECQPALAELCQQYWYPLYAYLRRRGCDAAAAEDSVQAFFASFLERDIIRRADPSRGRFRGFLVTALKQFLARQHEYASAAKRCPPGPVLSIDAGEGESRYAREPVDAESPDSLFERTWAVSVLQVAMDRLRSEQERDGRTERFAAFQGVLTGQSARGTRELGQSLGMSEGAVRVAIHRLRQRYGELLREQVAATMEEGGDIEEELRHLMAALSRPRTP